MIWTHPAAAAALAALAVPLLIHILARQRATRVPFPTLRFIHPHRLASARRRMLEDRLLLALRAAVLACAAGAVAGPLIVTVSRLRVWDSRTIRADVAGRDLSGSLRRAVSWLDHQPPGRREIVVGGFIPIGALSDADIAAVPAHVGIRFERGGEAPASRVLQGPNVVVSGRVVEAETTLNRDWTSVRDGREIGETSTSVDVTAPASQQASLARLRTRFDVERRPAPLAGHTARVEFGVAEGTGAPSVGWMADAAAAIARDLNPGDASTGTLPLHFGTDANRLVVRTAVAPDDRRALELLRAVARSLAPSPTRPDDEIVPIADAQLRAWTREPAPALPPTKDMIDSDDRRWLWGLVLVLIGLEAWVRTRRRSRRMAPGVAQALTTPEDPSRAA